MMGDETLVLPEDAREPLVKTCVKTLFAVRRKKHVWNE